jgi:predicted anti-sigma-YlaC factor YlaD
MEEKRCKSLLGSLSDYVDGIAQEQICQEIERHLNDCDDCRVVVDTLKKTISLYHASHATELSLDMRERLFMRLDLGDFTKKE